MNLLIKTFVRVMFAAVLLIMVGCHRSSGSSSAPVAVSGVDTPSSISVVTANNAD